MANISTIARLNDEILSYSLQVKPSAVHSKISIVGNAQLNAFFAGNSSDGTIGNPHIIQGFEINAGGTGSAIYIANTNKHVVIQGCTLQGSGSTSGSAGIRLNNCTNVIIRSNSITANAMHGVQVEAGSRFINIIGNTITANTYVGINLYYARDSIISKNVISGVSNSSSDGIILGNVMNVTASWNNISSLVGDGIWLSVARYCHIIGNRITGCYYTGITSSESSHNLIENNIITRCTTYGFEIINDSCDNNITHNLVTNCRYAGIRFYNGNDNITGNKIWNNAFVNNRDGQSLTRWMNPGENDWDVNGIGNYWSDYTARYPDATQSGNIWSIPYAINETTNPEDHDHFPLVSIDLLGTDQGPVDAGWIIAIIVIAFIACAVLVVFKAYKIGVLFPPGFKPLRGRSRTIWRSGAKI